MRGERGGCQGGTSTGIFVDLGTTPTHFPHKGEFSKTKMSHTQKLRALSSRIPHAGCVTQGTQRMCVRFMRRCERSKVELDEKIISKVRDKNVYPSPVRIEIAESAHAATCTRNFVSSKVGENWKPSLLLANLTGENEGRENPRRQRNRFLPTR